MAKFSYDDVSSYTLDDADEAALSPRRTSAPSSGRTGRVARRRDHVVRLEGGRLLAERVVVAGTGRRSAPGPSGVGVRDQPGHRDPGVADGHLKGHCEVFSDAETKAWFLPALAERLRPGNPTAQAQFVALNDTDNRRVLKVTPVQRIGFDGRKMARATKAALE